MSIEWKERVHEDKEIVALHNLEIVVALRECGLLKFFQTPCMQS